MGNKNSGRRPQPTAMKVLRGNPGRRPLNAHEPQPPAAPESFDIPPVELDDDPIARTEWTRIAPMLRISGLVTQAEQSTLMALCQKWSQYLEAHRNVRRIGMVVKKPSGVPALNPYLMVENEALNQCRKLWVELGLTPSGRSRMTALPVDEAPASKWAGLL